MRKESTTIRKAEFNPSIKTYILIVTGFLFFISIIGIPIMIVWYLGLGQYISRRYYENLKCTLTTHHLEFKIGVLFKVEKTIPLENIQDLTFIQNPLLNLLDLKVLKIETAGQSNPNGSDMKLMGIVNSADFKDAVLKQRELLTNNLYRSDAGNGNENQTLSLLSEIRDILNEIKNK